MRYCSPPTQDVCVFKSRCSFKRTKQKNNPDVCLNPGNTNLTKPWNPDACFEWILFPLTKDATAQWRLKDIKDPHAEVFFWKFLNMFIDILVAELSKISLDINKNWWNYILDFEGLTFLESILFVK